MKKGKGNNKKWLERDLKNSNDHYVKRGFRGVKIPIGGGMVDQK